MYLRTAGIERAADPIVLRVDSSTAPSVLRALAGTTTYLAVYVKED
jgi:hypothetical protein